MFDGVVEDRPEQRHRHVDRPGGEAASALRRRVTVDVGDRDAVEQHFAEVAEEVLLEPPQIIGLRVR